MDACVENKQPKENSFTDPGETDHKNESMEMKPAEREHPCTPAVVRTRQSKKDFQVSSPSDAIMSPCTQRLFGRSSRLKNGHGIQPVALLKEKQRTVLTQTDPDTVIKIGKFNRDN